MANEKGKGLKFMSLHLDIVKKRIELQTTKAITPSEALLLQLIELGTIGAQNSRRSFTSKTKFYLEDLSKALGYKQLAKLWRLLKSLETKKLIVREKARSKAKEILGLNPDVFGQILIDSLHEEEQNRHKKRDIKLIVDNVQNDVDNSKSQRTNRSWTANESFVDSERIVRDEHTNRSRTEHENALDSSRTKNSLRLSERERDFSSSENGNGNLSTRGKATPIKPREVIPEIKESTYPQRIKEALLGLKDLKSV